MCFDISVAFEGGVSTCGSSTESDYVSPNVAESEFSFPSWDLHSNKEDSAQQAMAWLLRMVTENNCMWIHMSEPFLRAPASLS